MSGIAEILTIYPGWYSGRTPHIHAKVHLSNDELLTTQLYFDEDTTAKVYRRGPYSERGPQNVKNTRDGIFSADTVLTLSERSDGWLGLITIGVRR